MHANELVLLLSAYREGAEGTSSADPHTANIWQRRMHISYKILRESEHGRDGISALMKDPNPHIRCWAAAHSLAWNVMKAKKALIELQESEGPCSFDAEMILREYDKGALSFDY